MWLFWLIIKSFSPSSSYHIMVGYRSNSTTATNREGAAILLYSEKTYLTERKVLQMNLKTGMTGESSTLVVHENTAASVGAGGVEVFGTPMMIALMEQASWRAVVDSLDEGDVTVGTLVNVRHLGATPLGQKIRATSELVVV